MEDLICKGPTMPINVEKSFGELFWDTSMKYGDKIFQIDAHTGVTETFKEVQKKAVRVAINLKQTGVNPKDIVMVCCESNFDNVILNLACLFIGAYPANFFITMDLHGAKNILSDMTPKVLFVSDQKLNILKAALDALNLQPQIYIIGSQTPPFKRINEIYENPARDEHNFRPEMVDVHETALILFSSGTTGKPKGICLSHLAILPSHSRDFEFNTLVDRPLVQFAPLCYISSVWNLGINTALASPMIIGTDIGAEMFLKLVEKYKVPANLISYATAVNLANLDEDIVNKYNLSSIHLIAAGGSFIHPKYIARLRQIFTNAIVVPLYGSTEMGTTPFTWKLLSPDARVANYDTKLDSVGVVDENCEVKVVDINTGKVLGPNQKGEILVKSPHRMNGYYNQTKQPFDEEGFLHSGDLGSYDEQGFFYILDRLCRSFKYQGRFVYPGLVEERLTQHPSVKGAVIIDFPHELDGSRAMACVSLEQDCDATSEQLGDFIVEKMGEHYRPVGGFKFLKNLPVTNSGKINISKLRAMYKFEYGTVK